MREDAIDAHGRVFVAEYNQLIGTIRVTRAHMSALDPQQEPRA